MAHNARIGRGATVGAGELKPITILIHTRQAALGIIIASVSVTIVFAIYKLLGHPLADRNLGHSAFDILCVAVGIYAVCVAIDITADRRER
jgi:hypothetical protein